MSLSGNVIKKTATKIKPATNKLCILLYSHFYSSVPKSTIYLKKVKVKVTLVCLPSFGAESVVFQVAIQKLKDQDI